MKTKLLAIAVITIVFFGNLIGQPLRGYFRDKLDLTDKQIAEIEKLRDEHLKKMSDLKNELEKLAIDLRSEWRKSNPDRKKIEVLTDKMSELRARIQKQRLNHWFDVYNLLDEKQKEKFRELRSEFFKDGKFMGPKFRKDFPIRKPGCGPCPCGMHGPWWDKD
ncbi:MAG: Spy/CpxP family protein refolding chaperone [Ignavibacteria bacterium]|nr:Spy/CpxP family protein refolding chaperone [Ignavibacteria bacterium]